jgi:hypothetical protein
MVRQIAGNKCRSDNFPPGLGFVPCRQYWRNYLTSTSNKVFCVLLLSLAGLLLAGCPPRESIEKINRDPGRFAGKDITIAGRVTDSFGAMGSGVFQIDDGTGTMWVLSEKHGVPGNGAELAVTGRIQQGFAFGGHNFATILRETRRQH